MPLPGTKVIPDGWSAHHQPTAEGQMTATGSLSHPPSGEPTGWNEQAGRSVYGAASEYWSGPVRVQRGGQGQAVVDGDGRQVTLRGYQVSVPSTVVEVRVNDLLTVATCGEDPDLVGRVLRVVDVRYGSLRWQRDLICDDTTPTSR